MGMQKMIHSEGPKSVHAAEASSSEPSVGSTSSSRLEVWASMPVMTALCLALSALLYVASNQQRLSALRADNSTIRERAEKAARQARLSFGAAEMATRQYVAAAELMVWYGQRSPWGCLVDIVASPEVERVALQTSYITADDLSLGVEQLRYRPRRREYHLNVDFDSVQQVPVKRIDYVRSLAVGEWDASLRTRDQMASEDGVEERPEFFPQFRLSLVRKAGIMLDTNVL